MAGARFAAGRDEAGSPRWAGGLVLLIVGHLQEEHPQYLVSMIYFFV
jgi:hypothetical protein